MQRVPQTEQHYTKQRGTRKNRTQHKATSIQRNHCNATTMTSKTNHLWQHHHPPTEGGLHRHSMTTRPTDRLSTSRREALPNQVDAASSRPPLWRPREPTARDHEEENAIANPRPVPPPLPLGLQAPPCKGRSTSLKGSRCRSDEPRGQLIEGAPRCAKKQHEGDHREQIHHQE
jgi:hypothetical protein